eukprot:scaffold166760_cov16-Tisochrysis_lutea.AAC.1
MLSGAAAVGVQKSAIRICWPSHLAVQRHQHSSIPIKAHGYQRQLATCLAEVEALRLMTKLLPQ